MKFFNVLIFILFPHQLFAQKIVDFKSSEIQTNLIELYTSQGCSSCPPADKKMIELINSDDLWTKYVPLAFHVDYWDYIGWKDVYAKPAHTQRQRIHKFQSNLSSVYTPGFVINGSEWRGYYNYKNSFPESTKNPGILSAQLDRNKLTINFNHTDKQLMFNYAVLGLGLENAIKKGENTGKVLKHQFVVLHHDSVIDNSPAIIHGINLSKFNSKKLALAIWVSDPDSLIPIQATGGYLN
jgi:hypothetical protein